MGSFLLVQRGATMQSRIKKILFLIFSGISFSSWADSISDAIARQEAMQAAAQQAAIQQQQQQAVLSQPVKSTGTDVPVLFSVMALNNQYVLRFNTTKGSYIVTNDFQDIGNKWKLVRFEGLSALIQRGNEKPVRVYLSVPGDEQQVQSFAMNTPPLP